MKDYGDEIVRTLKYLNTSPSLEALQERYPEEWKAAEVELAAAIRDKDKARLDELMRPLHNVEAPRKRTQPITKQESRDLQGKLVRQRMSAISIERYLKTSLHGSKSQHFSVLDRILLRILFFGPGRSRKLVSPVLFRLLWPRFRQKNLLMPTAEANGIYCFFTSATISALAGLMREGSCLEVGAGDGFLSARLKEEGVDIKATDDFSWAGKIENVGEVEQLDAAAAVAKYKPSTVLCCWPPAQNRFEQSVLEEPSVRRYIVIGSIHKALAGNWPLYQAQKAFSIRRDADLSASMPPLEAGGAVYIFDRAK
ncbi:hypothetical protein [Dongia sp.]|uniref:hypothetical protein n=1 Tax=Dongia sp. TaxID=1977262 RepID=UPI0035AE9192